MSVEARFTDQTGDGTEAPEIAMLGLVKEFPTEDPGRRHRVLDGIDLIVRRGQFVCLVGPSGCGKSTLLNIVAGFETADAGTLEVDGRPIAGPGPDRVMVFQDYSLFPWMSTVENVEYGLRVRGMKRDARRRRALEFLDLVGLGPAASKPVYRLSGGMRQRVALVRALVLEPRVLLMDEPFAAVDAQQRFVLQQELVGIWTETGQTVLFVTHSLDEAIYLGDEIKLMTTEPGKVALSEEIDLPRPRDTTSVDFNKIKRRLGEFLEHEVARAEAARNRELAAYGREGGLR